MCSLTYALLTRADLSIKINNFAEMFKGKASALWQEDTEALNSVSLCLSRASH